MKIPYTPPLVEVVLVDTYNAILAFSQGSEIVVPMSSGPFDGIVSENPFDGVYGD